MFECLCHGLRRYVTYMTLVEPDIGLLLLLLFICANDCITQCWSPTFSIVRSKQYKINRRYAILRFPTTSTKIPSTKFASTFLVFTVFCVF